jgi:4Fe-4S ferredoxin
MFRVKRVQDTKSGYYVEQAYLTKTKRLEYDEESCIGCGICETVCPKEAISLTEAKVENGRMKARAKVEIDPSKCIMCGTCVVFCPSGALRATEDGEKMVPVLENEAMPRLRKNITVDSERCDISCELRCAEECLVDAINVETRQEGGETEIVGVEVDTSKCIYCSKCAAACPFGLIYVEMPFEGKVTIETEKCPDGCRACVDSCPSGALELDSGEKPVVDLEFCILCSACEVVCPEDAVKVERTSVAYEPVKSGAWFKALEKLTSYAVLTRELEKEALERRRGVVEETYSRRLA